MRMSLSHLAQSFIELSSDMPKEMRIAVSDPVPMPLLFRPFRYSESPRISRYPCTASMSPIGTHILSIDDCNPSAVTIDFDLVIKT
jgi:hypothetical protein